MFKFEERPDPSLNDNFFLVEDKIFVSKDSVLEAPFTEEIKKLFLNHTLMEPLGLMDSPLCSIKSFGMLLKMI